MQRRRINGIIKTLGTPFGTWFQICFQVRLLLWVLLQVAGGRDVRSETGERMASNEGRMKEETKRQIAGPPPSHCRKRRRIDGI
jgi:hypothetical protein